jgi:hypothetical protein
MSDTKYFSFDGKIGANNAILTGERYAFSGFTGNLKVVEEIFSCKIKIQSLFHDLDGSYFDVAKSILISKI